MKKVVGIAFEGATKVYWFAAGDFEYALSDKVIVETARGVEIGEVKTLPEEVEDSKVKEPLMPVIRKATAEDIQRHADNSKKIPEMVAIASQKASHHKLDMKIVSALISADNSKLIFTFTAENRVDFRELVKDLASTFHTRIELRQIGERDECKMIGGLGPCGRECCCSIGCDFCKVNIKMAKNQNLSLNPQKISGTCGRLMCCLSYENEHYVEANKLLPKIGASVKIIGVAPSASDNAKATSSSTSGNANSGTSSTSGNKSDTSSSTSGNKSDTSSSTSGNKSDTSSSTSGNANSGTVGIVTGTNQLKLTVRVKTETPSGYEFNDYPLDQLEVL